MAGKTLVCFGDSLTEGVIGASYVDLLRDHLPLDVRVVNAGVNGDTTLNLLRRLERDVVPYNPDVVVVLVGLNDLGVTYGDASMQPYYRLLKRVPAPIPPQTYARLYRRIIAELREHTGARLVLCTPTTIGECLDDALQARVEAYSTVVTALAHQEQLALVDLRRAFCEAMRADPRTGPPYRIWTPLLDEAAISLLGHSYTTLRERRGYRLLCDGVHLGEAGSALVAETMLPTLCRELGVRPREQPLAPA